ncbi:MAG: 3'(2'),5'-bisphosphate nucleotidase CysQ [bacterium]|nr:3'(2'),5'-bisphosphate nucleotidase CysQ [bacterium]
MQFSSQLISIVQQAGAVVMEIYRRGFEVMEKDDRSPLTEADLAAHHLIKRRLEELTPDTPVLSEESATGHDYDHRKGWREFWLVDPLDGTKEFLKRNGQFTINIALIRDRRPVAGIVHAPAKELTYLATEDGTASKIEGAGSPQSLPKRQPAEGDSLRIAGSLSHHSTEMDRFVDEQKHRYRDVQFIAMGSSLKLCLVADGQADIYPRFGPTMEWDTAAAHAVVNAAGCRVLRWGSEEELTYNKENLLNPWFVVTPNRPASS